MGARRLAQMWEDLPDTEGRRACAAQAAGGVACSPEAQLPTKLPGGELTSHEMSQHGGYVGAIAARGVQVPSSWCCEAPAAAMAPGLIY